MMKTEFHYPRTLEAAAWIVSCIVLVLLLRGLLIDGTHTLVHDHAYWGYAPYQFYAEHLLEGSVPWWNPYSHGGERFYPIMVHSHLLDPTVPLIIWAGRCFTTDLVLLYNWTYFLQLLIMAFGSYLVLRPLARGTGVRSALIAVILFSSYMLSSLRQPGFLYQFMWTPYVLAFLLKIVDQRDYRWANWITLAALTGLTFQSYFFTGTIIAATFFILGFFLFNRARLKYLVREPGNRLKFLCASLIVVAMMAPDIVMMGEKNDCFFPARTMASGPKPHVTEALPEDIKKEDLTLSYELLIRSGASVSAYDFIQTLCPGANIWLGSDRRDIWGRPSEACLYLGMSTWALCLFGMLAGRHRLKKVVLTTLLGITVVVLCNKAGVFHLALFHIFPPLWYLRNTHSLTLLLQFILLYFFVLGLNRLLRHWPFPRLFPGDRCTPNGIPIFKVAIFAATVFLCLVETMELEKTYENRQFIYRLISTASIMLATITGYVLRNHLGRFGLWFALLIAQSMLISWFSFSPLRSCSYMAIGLWIPVAILALTWRRYGGRGKRFPPRLAIFLGVLLICDLGFNLNKSTQFLRLEQHPKTRYGASTNAAPLRPPSARVASLPSLESIARSTGVICQAIRYPEILYRRPSVFSPKHHGVTFTSYSHPDPFENALMSRRWATFFFYKRYFELIHAQLEPAVLKSIFAVQADPFQFKSEAISYDNKDFVDWAKEEDSIEQLIGTVVFVENVENARFPIFNPHNLSTAEAIDSTRTTATEAAFRYRISAFHSHSDLTVEATSNRDGLLYWADGYEANWRAFLDGSEVPILRANSNFKAVGLPSGTHSIRFVYDPLPFKIAYLLFYGGLMTSCLVLLLQKLLYSSTPIISDT